MLFKMSLLWKLTNVEKSYNNVNFLLKLLQKSSLKIETIFKNELFIIINDFTLQVKHVFIFYILYRFPVGQLAEGTINT